jgi:uncharacterized damage-inducible protein DinB
MRQPTTTALLAGAIEEGYRARAWHGTNLKGSLRGISAREAAQRPGRGRHNIWEIALHCAYWKYVVRRRILGEKRGAFPARGSNWFSRPVDPSETAWRADLKLLETTHRELLAAVATITPAMLPEKPRASKVSNRAILLGIAMHDVYHAGQIQIIKRMIRR